MENKFTVDDLRAMQALSLGEKVLRSQTRIIEFYQRLHGKVAISFSGGKDSTVLLHLVRQIYPDVSAIFCNTGLEFPEIGDFVKRQSNITILRPAMSFKQVIDKYGWCYPSKEVSRFIEAYRRGAPYAIKRLNGEYNQYSKRFRKWKYLVDLPYKFSDTCCDVMKKDPIHQYQKDTGNFCYIGTLATESALRKQRWLQHGCNILNGKEPKSRPLSFWTEQDILQYIVDNQLKIASIYGNIVKTKNGLKTTGEQRTGCVFCPVGCHLKKPNQFQRLQYTHPKLYEYCMNKLGMRDFLKAINVPYKNKEIVLWDDKP